MSVPGRDYPDENETRGLMSLGGFGSGRNLIRFGKDSFRENEQGSCSLHGTLRRGTGGDGLWGSNGGFNNPDLTMEDDVFDDTASPLPGLMAATTCRSTTSGVGSRAIFLNPPDTNPHPRFAYLSKGKTFIFNNILHDNKTINC